jgi:myosin heavy subunit
MLLTACQPKETVTSDKVKDSLLAVVNSKDAYINEFIASFNELEQNIDSVAAKQHTIRIETDWPGELKPTQKVRINEQIKAINELMDENRKKLVELNRKLKNSAFKNKGLENSLTILSNQLTQKNAELLALNDKLKKLDSQVAQLQTYLFMLNAENEVQSLIIANETETIHTAYYVLGTTKELQKSKIIDRKGGILGMGRTTKLSVDFDESKFMCIDYTETTSIAINSKMTLATNHPSNAYTLETDEKDKGKILNLVITNPELFWSVSKYLVIVKG